MTIAAQFHNSLDNSVGRYINGRGFWWIKGPGINHLTDCPTGHFSPEFLYDPWDEYIVDWSTVPVAGVDAGLLPKKTLPEISGLLVKHIATGRVWKLTGEYDREKNTYVAHWPD